MAHDRTEADSPANDAAPQPEPTVAVQDISEQEAEALLAQESEPVLLMVYADWCGFCKRASPVMDSLAGARKDVRIVKIESNQAKHLVQANNITGFPTFLHNFGEKKSVGFKTMDQMVALVNTKHNGQRQAHAPMPRQAMQAQQAHRQCAMQTHQQAQRIVAHPHRIDSPGSQQTVVETESEQVVRDALAGNEPVIVAIVAPWCGYSKKYAPVLDEVAASAPYVKVYKIENENCQGLCADTQVTGFPTTLYNWGKGKDVGYKSAAELLAMIEQSVAH